MIRGSGAVLPSGLELFMMYSLDSFLHEGSPGLSCPLSVCIRAK